MADTRLPNGLIYQGDRDWMALWLKPAPAGLAMLVIGSVFIWILYGQINRRFELGLSKPKLSLIMTGLFICLTIPILFFILVYNYRAIPNQSSPPRVQT